MVVAGGGAVATRRVADLLDCGASVAVVAPVTSPELDQWESEGRLTIHRRRFRPDDLDGAWLVMAATDDDGVNAAVVAAAGERRCFASSATPPAGGASLRPMAVLRRGHLEVAVGTSGRSPGLAAWLRDRLAGEVGPEFADLVALAGEVRPASRASGVGEGSDWCGTLKSGILEAIRAGRWDEAREGLRTCHS